MPKSKFLKIFALLEMFSATIFLALALIFFLSRESMGGDVMIPAIFGFIGVCSFIAAPVLMKFAKKAEEAEQKTKH
jgi:preprotein translocase subunit SecF